MSYAFERYVPKPIQAIRYDGTHEMREWFAGMFEHASEVEGELVWGNRIIPDGQWIVLQPNGKFVLADVDLALHYDRVVER